MEERKDTFRVIPQLCLHATLLTVPFSVLFER